MLRPDMRPSRDQRGTHKFLVRITHHPEFARMSYIRTNKQLTLDRHGSPVIHEVSSRSSRSSPGEPRDPHSIYTHLQDAYSKSYSQLLSYQ